MPPLPNVQLSYGPMLIGVFFNMILYGVFIGQALTYYKSYHQDGARMRYFVLYLFVLETLNTGFDMAMMYQPLILEYGQKPNYFPVVFITEPMIVVLVSTPIQMFFAWRIWSITKMVLVPVIICIFSVAALAGGLWTAGSIGIIKQFSHKPELHDPALLWFLASCVADVLITVSLVMTLSHRKTGFVATDSVIDKIIRSTIQTGFVTAVFSILDVICFMVFPYYAVNFVWDLALSKLYSNALLSTLNARAHLNAISAPRPSGPPEYTAHNLVFEDMALVTGGTRDIGTLASKFDEAATATEPEMESAAASADLGLPRGLSSGDSGDADITETPRMMLYSGGSSTTCGRTS
ncbi:hypothetical protein B0H15DRAFT_857129 [Mycena belliarum]|uniref:DUF6534 domain-containing protein n=1 Tax=Mycena belliarum TaxID=1033014 RepID=A0AAD6U033_9AGAR|nr:hypothetical protein B0H15DRAFT_857129 [Mycena belliae]